MRKRAVEAAIKQLREDPKVIPKYRSIFDIYLPTHSDLSGISSTEASCLGNIFGVKNRRRAREARVRKSRIKRLFNEYSEQYRIKEGDDLCLPYPERSFSGVQLTGFAQKLQEPTCGMICISKIMECQYRDLLQEKYQAISQTRGVQAVHTWFTGEDVKALIWSNITKKSPFDYWRTKFRTGDFSERSPFIKTAEVRKSESSMTSSAALSAPGEDLLSDSDIYLVSLLPLLGLTVENSNYILKADSTEMKVALVGVWADAYGGSEGLDHVLVGMASPWKLKDEQRGEYRNAIDIFTSFASANLTKTEVGGDVLYFREE